MNPVADPVQSAPAIEAPAPAARPAASLVPDRRPVPRPWRERERLLGLLLCGGLALVMTLPLWGGPWFDSHEYTRYVSRALEYVRDLRDGALVPRWAPDFYGGYGSPFFDFFPPGVFAAAAPFSLLGLSVPAALKLAMLLFTAAGACGAFELVRRETGRADAALVAGAAFAFAPYRFVDLFVRGDLAEYAGIALVPWTLLHYRELGRVSRERLPRTAFLAALCHGGVLLCHAIIGQWVTEAVFALALLPAVADWRRGRRFRALAPLCALAGAVGVAAIFVVPALLEKRFAHFDTITSGYGDYYDFRRHLVPPADFLRFGYYGFAGDFPPYRRMPFSVGVPLAAAAILSAAALLGARSRRVLRAGLPFWIGTAAFLFLMTPAAEWAYHVLPLAPYIQFPWRLLGLVAAFGAAATGVAWAASVGGPLERARWPLALAAVALIALDAHRMERVVRYDAPWQIPSNGADVAAAHCPNNHFLEATASEDEHLPRWAPAPPTVTRTDLLAALPAGLRASAVQRDGGDYRVEVDAPAPAEIDLNLHDFPGWRVRTSAGPAAATIGPSPTGLTRIALAAAGRYQLEVSFGTTPVRAAAAALSLLTLLLFVPAMRLLGRLRGLAPPEAGPGTR